MTQNKETQIIELINSRYDEDVILGCILAAKEMGRDWCKDTLHKRVPLNIEWMREHWIMLRFAPQFHIWLGPYGVSFYAKYIPEHFAKHEFIDYAD